MFERSADQELFEETTRTFPGIALPGDASSVTWPAPRLATNPILAAGRRVGLDVTGRARRGRRRQCQRKRGGRPGPDGVPVRPARRARAAADRAISVAAAFGRWGSDDQRAGPLAELLCEKRWPPGPWPSRRPRPLGRVGVQATRRRRVSPRRGEEPGRGGCPGRPPAGDCPPGAGLSQFSSPDAPG